MELHDYLSDGGSEKLNVIAISWTEGRYGFASPARLRSFVRPFHPDIKIIHATDRIEKNFSPLIYVPANFFFDGKGNLKWGDGGRHYLDKSAVTEIVNGIKG